MAWEANNGIAVLERRHGNGHFTEVKFYRYITDVLRRGGDDALSVNCLEITGVHATTGAQLSPNSVITDHRLSADNVVDVAQAGRGRWKVENENNQVRKTTGYHLEHNGGHGQQSLSAFMLGLNLLAFLFHTVLEWSDARDALLRRVLTRRQTFFEDIRTFTRYMVFDSWDHLLAFMSQGLELQPQFDTSSSPKLALLGALPTARWRRARLLGPWRGGRARLLSL